MFKVIVAGGRDFADYKLLTAQCNWYLSLRAPSDVEIVCGMAKGADSLGAKYACERGITVRTFPADWDKYGKQAGYMRNKEMADYADALIAFWDGKSKGTLDMIRRMKQSGKPCRIVRYGQGISSDAGTG